MRRINGALSDRRVYLCKVVGFRVFVVMVPVCVLLELMYFCGRRSGVYSGGEMNKNIMERGVLLFIVYKEYLFIHELCDTLKTIFAITTKRNRGKLACPEHRYTELSSFTRTQLCA